jgi:hypothetical protein
MLTEDSFFWSVFSSSNPLVHFGLPAIFYRTDSLFTRWLPSSGLRLGLFTNSRLPFDYSLGYRLPGSCLSLPVAERDFSNLSRLCMIILPQVALFVKPFWAIFLRFPKTLALGHPPRLAEPAGGWGAAQRPTSRLAWLTTSPPAPLHSGEGCRARAFRINVVGNTTSLPSAAISIATSERRVARFRSRHKETWPTGPGLRLIQKAELGVTLESPSRRCPDLVFLECLLRKFRLGLLSLGYCTDTHLLTCELCLRDAQWFNWRFPVMAHIPAYQAVLVRSREPEIGFRQSLQALQPKHSIPGRLCQGYLRKFAPLAPAQDG